MNSFSGWLGHKGILFESVPGSSGYVSRFYYAVLYFLMGWSITCGRILSKLRVLINSDKNGLHGFDQQLIKVVLLCRIITNARCHCFWLTIKYEWIVLFQIILNQVCIKYNCDVRLISTHLTVLAFTKMQPLTLGCITEAHTVTQFSGAF